MSDGRLPDEEPTFTTLPHPRSAMPGRGARISRIEAITCSSHCSCHSSSVELLERPRTARAGVVDEHVDGPPKRSSHAPRSPPAAPGSVTSAASAAARPPSDRPPLPAASSAARHEQHARALGAQRARGGQADAAGSRRSPRSRARRSQVHGGDDLSRVAARRVLGRGCRNPRRTAPRAPAAGTAATAPTRSLVAVGERRRLGVGVEDARIGGAEQAQHREVDLAVAAVRRRVDEPCTAVRAGQHVAAPEVAVQARGRLGGPASSPIRSHTRSTAAAPLRESDPASSASGRAAAGSRSA